MSECCTIEELDRFLTGGLDDTISDQVRRHTQSCRPCQSILNEIGGQADLAGTLRRVSASLDVDALPREVRQEWSPEGFDIIREIHRGGQGIVYEAVQKTTGRRVAIKVLRDDRVDSERARQRIEREFELVRDLAHPNIVRLYDAGTDGGRRYLVMEHIEGQHLDAFVASMGLNQEQILRLFARICEAVQFAHQRGVIHRDLKPRNILVGVREEPRILDFGVARLIDPLLDTEHITATDEFAGTLPYASPEQVGGDASAVDIRTDVYSLGVLLYQMLSGTHPYAEQLSVKELVRAITEQEPPPASRRNGAIGRDLDAIIAKAMAKDRSHRYQSAQSLRDDVHRFLAGEPVEARRGARWYVLRKTLLRYRVIVGMVALLMTVFVAASAVSFRLWRDAESEATRAREATEDAKRELALRRKLSDVKTARELIEQAEVLYPIGEPLAVRCDRWLESARAVVGQREVHERERRRIRQRSLPYTDAERGRQHPLDFDELVTARRALAAATGYEQREALSKEVDRLREIVGRRETWAYDDSELAWLDELLSELLEKIRSLETLVPDIEDRRVRSLSLRHRTLEVPAAAWAEAVREVKANPRYGGLDLVPQVGLVPLGVDPHSGLYEFWHVESGDRPRRSPGGSGYIVEDRMGIVLVLLPGGTGLMGTTRVAEGPLKPYEDPFATADCAPVHAYDLDPFFLSKYEMTRSQWSTLHGEAPVGGYARRGLFLPQRTGPRHPVANIDWFAAEETVLDLGLTLPTEAQWEYACRGGTATRWFTGDTLASLNGYANVLDAGQWPKGSIATVEPTPEIDDGEKYLATVGRYKPNGFGLHDVIGNVKEWCADWVVEYSESAPPRGGDGLRLAMEVHSMRVLRGGSCALRAEWGGSGIRDYLEPDHTDNYGGIRPARPLDP